MRVRIPFRQLCDPESTWGANREATGLNVLLLRWSDLPPHADEQLVAALRASSFVRRGPTLVLLPPTNHDHCSDTRAAELRSIERVAVFDSAALRTAFDRSANAWHSPWLDRVAHAPLSPAANSVLASLVCRELHRACAPTRKVYCLDCDDTLWGGAVGELGPRGVVMSEAHLGVQRRFVERVARGALVCLISRNSEEDVRSVRAPAPSLSPTLWLPHSAACAVRADLACCWVASGGAHLT